MKGGGGGGIRESRVALKNFQQNVTKVLECLE